jgi:hypothetical protein
LNVYYYGIFEARGLKITASHEPTVFPSGRIVGKNHEKKLAL